MARLWFVPHKNRAYFALAHKPKAMKKMLFAVALFWCTATLQAAIPAKLQGVKVYLQGAELRHLANLQVNAGEQQLIITGLAGQIDDRSIRLASDKAGITVLGYQLRQNFLRQNDDLPEIRSLLDSIMRYTRLQEDDRVRTEVLVQEQQMILANKQVGGSNSGMSVLELQKLAEFYRSRLSELNLKILQAKRVDAEHNERIKKLRQQLDQRKALLPEFVQELVLDISAEMRSTGTLEITYTSPNVYWEPFYDLRAESLSKPLQLIAKARIVQQTAIDWQDVEVAISSAVPAQFVSKPILNPWVLDFVELYHPVAGHAPRAYQAETMSMDAAGGFSNLKTNIPTKQVNYLNYEYKPKERVTIRHNEARLVTLEEKMLENSYGHYVAPKQQKDVLLMAYVTGWEKLNLLPGNARIYLENALVGESWMNFQGGDSDTLELSLGIDKRVQVSYDQQCTFTSDRRLGNSRKKDYAYTIKIRNSHQAPVNLMVEDVIPISANKEIEVTDVKLGSAQTVNDKGLLRWKLNVGAGGQQQLDYSFSVKYPKNKTVGNL